MGCHVHCNCFCSLGGVRCHVGRHPKDMKQQVLTVCFGQPLAGINVSLGYSTVQPVFGCFVFQSHDKIFHCRPQDFCESLPAWVLWPTLSASLQCPHGSHLTFSPEKIFTSHTETLFKIKEDGRSQDDKHLSFLIYR